MPNLVPINREKLFPSNSLLSAGYSYPPISHSQSGSGGCRDETDPVRAPLELGGVTGLGGGGWDGTRNSDTINTNLKFADAF